MSTARARQPALPGLEAGPGDEVAILARQHSKLALAEEQLRLQRRVASLEAEVARLRVAGPAAVVAPILALTAPILIVSEANQRGLGWQMKASRVQRQKETVTACLIKAGALAAPRAAFDRGPAHLVGKAWGGWLLHQHPRLSVHLERRASGMLDDDNLTGGCKAVRDAIAAWLGCDDGPRGPVRWSYSQQAHRRWRNVPELLIEVRPLP